MTVVTAGGGKPRTKYMQVREEYVKERAKTGEVVIRYVNTKGMLADLLTKPLGAELYHTLTQRILGGHRYDCLSNRGAKEKLTSADKVGMSNSASVESVTQVLSDLTCSNHTSRQLERKHSTKHVPSANVKCKLSRK
jgi:hypothetical protein